MNISGDHFSAQAPEYAEFRPRYPDALGAWLASVAPSPTRVWDCATGSGQAATMLARHFREVVATDASAAQLAHATPEDRIVYRVAPAEASGMADGSCDAVTVAQAAHWFDLPAFYREAQRVLKPDGVLAVWGYALLHTDRPHLDEVVRHFQRERLAAYWPAGREYVDDEYRSLPFPYPLIDAPSFAMTARWRRRDLLGYISTWSAVVRCRQQEGRDPMDEMATALTEVWPDDEAAVDVRWPLFLKVTRGMSHARPPLLLGATS